MFSDHATPTATPKLPDLMDLAHSISTSQSLGR